MEAAQTMLAMGEIAVSGRRGQPLVAPMEVTA
jgi:hypothetical protein